MQAAEITTSNVLKELQDKFNAFLRSLEGDATPLENAEVQVSSTPSEEVFEVTVATDVAEAPVTAEAITEFTANDVVAEEATAEISAATEEETIAEFADNGVATEEVAILENSTATEDVVEVENEVAVEEVSGIASDEVLDLTSDAETAAETETEMPVMETFDTTGEEPMQETELQEELDSAFISEYGEAPKADIELRVDEIYTIKVVANEVISSIDQLQCDVAELKEQTYSLVTKDELEAQVRAVLINILKGGLI